MIEITKIDDNGFHLVQDGVESNQPAKYIVAANNDTVTLTSSADFFRKQIIGKYDEYTINGVVPSSADEAVQLLRAFVFLRSEGGGGSGTGQPTSHSQLTGLDYNSSGHTGFASTNYVDTQINQLSADSLPITGGTLTGDLHAKRIIVEGTGITSATSGLETRGSGSVSPTIGFGAPYNGAIEMDSANSFKFKAAGTATASITAESFIKRGGSFNSMLMADGSVQPLYPFTWNVTIKGSITPGVFSGTTMEGLYYRVGDRFDISVRIAGSFTTAPTGDIMVSLPVAAKSAIIGGIVNVVGSSDYWYWRTLAYQNYLVITKLNNTTNMQLPEFTGNISFSGTYFLY